MNRKTMCYIGYALAAILVIVLFVTDLPKMVDAGLGILFASIFSISHSQLWHDKMLHTDKDYKTEVLDERNVAIKEKTGNIANMITLTLLGITTVIFIALDYIVPAIFTGAIIFLQPILLIFISSSIEKRM